MIGLLGYLPWAALGPIAVVNGIPEAVASAIITLAVIVAWRQIDIGRGNKSEL